MILSIPGSAYRRVTLSQIVAAARETGQPRGVFANVTRSDVIEACKRRRVIIKDGRVHFSYLPNIALELGRMAQAEAPAGVTESTDNRRPVG